MSEFRWRTAATLFAVFIGSGCVTVAEHRKVERDVIDLQRGQTGAASGSRLADLSSELDAARDRLRTLEGRLEVVEKKATEALAEARRARQELANRPTAASRPAEPAPEKSTEAPASDEVAAYRSAYSAWRRDEARSCIDQFRKFLQTYPASAYADDAAYWLADCHFKQGDYKNAVLRFDDVVRNFATGNKAPDALYRQGESLLKLGPGFHEAAKRAFERVIAEYPDSARAREAKKQIQLLAAG